MRRRRTTLATRIALLSIGIVLVTGLVAGLLAAGLLKTANADNGRRVLSRLADVAQSVATDRPRSQKRAVQALRRSNVRIGIVGPDGRLRSSAAIVRDALTSRDLERIGAGNDLHVVRQVRDTTVFVEARSVGDGRGLVLVQAKRDAAAQDGDAIRRITLALLIAGAVAAMLGLLVAWRLARPLRRTASAARSVAAGNRDVRLPAAGPREVVEVSDAVTAIAGALGHSEARQREFLLSVSHDLRTPLTAISGYAESLAGGVVPAEDTAHVGSVVLGEAKRLERLVGDLLDLARLGAQDFRVEPTTLDLVPVVEDAARVWSARSGAGDVRFATELAPGPLLVHTDAARVRQVLDGLFDNALRVTPAGAPIVLAVRPDPAGGAVVEVRDGGPGLSDDDLAVAFDQGALYRRYRGVRQVGTGLGLAIVHGLVERLGGSVEAGHANEGGARFTVRLPPPAERPAG